MAKNQRLHEVEKVRVKAFDPDLEWFLVASGSAMGERGTLASTIATLEIGTCDTGGVPNTDLYTDQQVGLGATTVGLVEKHRWLSKAWRTLPRETQSVLVACYSAPRAELRSDEGFGARDTTVTIEAAMRGEEETHRGSHKSVRTGVDGQLGGCASLAFMLITSDDDEETSKAYGRLLQACQNPSQREHSKTIREAIAEVQKAAKAAHDAWALAKEGSGGPRKNSSRSKPQAPHIPGEGDQ